MVAAAVVMYMTRELDVAAEGTAGMATDPFALVCHPGMDVAAVFGYDPMLVRLTRDAASGEPA